jgi:hypothetical protein
MTTSQNNFSIQEILDFIKENLEKKGYNSIRILGKTFREMNSYDGVNKINKDEFLNALRDAGILLPKSAAEVKCYFYKMSFLIFINLI